MCVIYEFQHILNKGQRPLTDFIRTNGVYQSTAKLSGEMHAACFMYFTSWKYIRFKKESEIIETFSSNKDLKILDKIKTSISLPDIKVRDNIKTFKFKKENWEDGTFTFNGSFYCQKSIKYYGHFRKKSFTNEVELILIGGDSLTDVYEFIEFKDNFALEKELLNLFSINKSISAIGELPNFGKSDIEMIFSFEKLVDNGYIEPIGTHHLDYHDYIRTKKGEEYLKSLK